MWLWLFEVKVEGITFTSGPTVAVGIVNVKKVIVNNCVFRNFIQGALDIYNCLSVNITYCVFEHNGPAAVVKPEISGVTVENYHWHTVH